MGLEESDGDKHQDEQDKHDNKTQNETKMTKYFSLSTKWECRFQTWHN